MKLISIIIVAFNEANNIQRVKESIDGMTLPSGYSLETILVDNGSTDHTETLANNYKFDIILRCPDLNIPSCRNRGVESASGIWIVFTDADCEFSPNWLLVAQPFFEDENTCVFGGITKLPANSTWVQQAWQFHWENKNTYVESYLGHPVIRRESFRMITTKNLAIRKHTLLHLNGFDESLATGEDTNLLFRAHLSNTPMLSVPSLSVTHYGEPATLTAFFRQQLWHANREAYRLIYAHRKDRKGGINAPLFTLAYLLVLLVGVTSLIMGCVFSPVVLVGIAPVLLLPIFLALRTCGHKNLRFLLPLGLLYSLYGCARVEDLIGLNPVKRAWKHYQRTTRSP